MLDMKVLWFANNYYLSQIKDNKNSYNGGGWINSILNVICITPNIDIYIASWDNYTESNIKQDNFTYIPIRTLNGFLNKFHKLTFNPKQDNYVTDKLLKVVDLLKPDIIQIFGSEFNYGLLAGNTDVPIVLHLQGILSPYLNAWFPPSFSLYNLIFSKNLSLYTKCKSIWAYKNNLYMAEREKAIFFNVKNYLGRTEWDKNVTAILNSKSSYFHCDEILRSKFYLDSNCWLDSNSTKTTIISTISSPLYKGFDLILKTSLLLKRIFNSNFEWKVFGIKDELFVQKELGIKCNEVNVYLVGVATEEVLIENLKKCTVYVHPSYIDNSPNSLCEAQILGVPIIATNVGGVSTLIKDRFSGILTPANDPYTLAKSIEKIISDNKIRKSLSTNGRKEALVRHNPNRIVSELLEIYKKLILK